MDSMYAYTNEPNYMNANMETMYSIQQQCGIEATNKDQLIHEYLQDLCAQKKLKCTLDSIFGDVWDVRDDIEPVISLALEQARKDVEQTCLTLNISAGKLLSDFMVVACFVVCARPNDFVVKLNVCRM